MGPKANAWRWGECETGGTRGGQKPCVRERRAKDKTSPRKRKLMLASLSGLPDSEFIINW
jgi:hypothetical protein